MINILFKLLLVDGSLTGVSTEAWYCQRQSIFNSRNLITNSNIWITKCSVCGSTSLHRIDFGVSCVVMVCIFDSILGYFKRWCRFLESIKTITVDAYE